MCISECLRHAQVCVCVFCSCVHRVCWSGVWCVCSVPVCSMRCTVSSVTLRGRPLPADSCMTCECQRFTLDVFAAHGGCMMFFIRVSWCTDSWISPSSRWSGVRSQWSLQRYETTARTNTHSFSKVCVCVSISEYYSFSNILNSFIFIFSLKIVVKFDKHQYELFSYFIML